MDKQEQVQHPFFATGQQCRKFLYRDIVDSESSSGVYEIKMIKIFSSYVEFLSQIFYRKQNPRQWWFVIPKLKSVWNHKY